MKHRIIGLGGAALLAASVWMTGAPAHAADTSQVSILHGVPGATVDVYANGEALLKNFKPGTLTDPQSLPADTYDLKVVKAGDGADGDAVIEANNVKVPGGANITVVAHLNEDGDPTLTPFVNDVSKIPAGRRGSPFATRRPLQRLTCAPEASRCSPTSLTPRRSRPRSTPAP